MNRKNKLMMLALGVTLIANAMHAAGESQDVKNFKFQQAVKQNNLDLVKSMSPNMSIHAKDLALRSAAEQRNLKMVNTLIDNGADAYTILDFPDYIRHYLLKQDSDIEKKLEAAINERDQRHAADRKRRLFLFKPSASSSASSGSSTESKSSKSSSPYGRYVPSPSSDPNKDLPN
jgi:hypothetical protein